MSPPCQPFTQQVCAKRLDDHDPRSQVLSIIFLTSLCIIQTNRIMQFVCTYYLWYIRLTII